VYTRHTMPAPPPSPIVKVASRVRLTPLMDRTRGRPDVRIGLVDGPVAFAHPDLETRRMREIAGKGACSRTASLACLHGTFVAGMLFAKRGSGAPAICPDCSLLVRPIFSEADASNKHMPSAELEELAAAILDCVDAGARVVNVSAALAPTPTKSESPLLAALDHAAKHEVIVVAAAGNQGTLGSSVLTRHAWTIPVAAYDQLGMPSPETNLGGSIGRRGLGAPGESITSLGAEGGSLTWSGSSAAAPFVTGAIALLWSVFPRATAAEMRIAVTLSYLRRRSTVAPPLLDAWASFQYLASTRATRGKS
jgi:subtilisin family serine protease